MQRDRRLPHGLVGQAPDDDTVGEVADRSEHQLDHGVAGGDRHGLVEGDVQLDRLGEVRGLLEGIQDAAHPFDVELAAELGGQGRGLTLEHRPGHHEVACGDATPPGEEIGAPPVDGGPDLPDEAAAADDDRDQALLPQTAQGLPDDRPAHPEQLRDLAFRGQLTARRPLAHQHPVLELRGQRRTRQGRLRRGTGLTGHTVRR